MKILKSISLICCLTVLYLISFVAYAQTETAIFAGGCFWSMQHDFDKMKGIVKSTVGYTGGHIVDPTYEQVSTGESGHYEAIKVEFDPAVISYEQVVDYYLHDIDPTDTEGQFCDHGEEYKAAIFYASAAQRKTAMAMSEKTAKRFGTIAVSIKPAQIFYPAEEYHQKYAEKNPERYNAYRTGCKRDEHLTAVWGTQQ